MGDNLRNGSLSTDFSDGIAKVVEQARAHIERSVNAAMCVTYYEVGWLIFEQEQPGACRAAYGKKMLDELSAYLSERYGKGWSVATLKNARQFYQVYSPSIRQSVISESQKMQHASEYNLYLPNKALLQRKLAEWTAEFEEAHGGDGE